MEKSSVCRTFVLWGDCLCNVDMRKVASEGGDRGLGDHVWRQDVLLILVCVLAGGSPIRCMLYRVFVTPLHVLRYLTAFAQKSGKEK